MKKINLLLFLLVLLPISFIKVNARMLTVSDVAKELDNEYITINVNSTNSTLDFSYQGKTVFSLKYTDEYLLYDDPVTEVTSDKAMYATYEPTLIPELIEAEFRLSGLSNVVVDDDIYDVNNYDTYGLAIKGIKYNLSNQNNGASSSVSGTYYNYIKLSLDTDKVTKLANTYGVKEGGNSDNLPSKDDDTSNDDKVAADDKNEEETKKDYKNPETGAFLPMLPILVLSLISIVVWSKVKNKFVKI